MDCLGELELVRLAADDLSAAESAVARGHLGRCDACRAEFEALTEIIATASDLARRNLSPAARRRIMAQAEQLLPLAPAERAERAQKRECLRQVRWIPAPGLAASAAAAAMFLVLMQPHSAETLDAPPDMTQRFEALLQTGEAVRAADARTLLASKSVSPDNTRTA